jgi:hypothetical protein
MELPGDEAQVEARFGPFGDDVSVSARMVQDLYRRLRNHFGCTLWNSQVTRLKWKLVLVRLEIDLILTQDQCTVCAEHTLGSEIVLDASDRTPK